MRKVQRQVVFLNGPPKCGKDTVANHLIPYLEFRAMKFAAPLKRSVAGLLDMTVEALERHKDEKFTILRKETEVEAGEFGTRQFEYSEEDTLRRLLIRQSEDFLKPVYGSTIFGRIALRELQRSANSLIIFTDCGFIEEVDPILRAIGVSNTLLIRLHRRGCTYDNDSRTYLPDIAGSNRDIENNDSIAHLTGRTAAAIRNYFKIQLLKDFEL